MKLSEWLETIESHGIYKADKIAERFKRETGHDACWSTQSVNAVKEEMQDRGCGGYVKGEDSERAATGYIMAMAIARKHVPGFKSTKMGRGFAFHEALDALKAIGL